MSTNRAKDTLASIIFTTFYCLGVLTFFFLSGVGLTHLGLAPENPLAVVMLVLLSLVLVGGFSHDR